MDWTEALSVGVLTGGKFRIYFEGKMYGFYNKLPIKYERKVKINSGILA